VARGLVVVLALATAFAIAACGPDGPGASGPVTTQPAPDPPIACDLVTVANARLAFGAASDPRRDPSATSDTETSCTFLAKDPTTELVVVAGLGGSTGLDAELTADEQDLSAQRQPVKEISGAFMISGVELGAPRIAVGVSSGNVWFTVSLRVADKSRPTLEARAVTLAKLAAPRLAH
jgi:hypothetical protein